MVKGAVDFARLIYKKHFDGKPAIDALVIHGHTIYA